MGKDSRPFLISSNMIKTYKANTNISINVVLASKKNLHVSFVPLSNGSSVFTTAREEVQDAIESHYKFGKLFVLSSTQESQNKKIPKVTTEKLNNHIGAISENGDENTECENPETGSDDNSESDNGLKKVTVCDIATARDYLAEHCGVSRTIMRNSKSILEHALANGIEFVGI